MLKQIKNKINAPAWYVLLTALVLVSLVAYSIIIPYIRFSSGIPIRPGYYANIHIFEKVPPSFYEKWTAMDIAGVLVCFFMGLVCLVLGIARNINKMNGRKSYLLAAFLILFGLNNFSSTTPIQEYINPVILFYVFWISFFTYAQMIFLFYFLYLKEAFQKWAWPLIAIPAAYGLIAFFMFFVFGVPFDMPTKLYTPMMITVYMLFLIIAFFGTEEKNMRVFFRIILVGWLCWLIYILIKTQLGLYFDRPLEFKNAMIIFSVFMVCFLVYVNIQEMSNYKSEVQKLENELLQKQISIMLSQIQPHFLYNVLVVIQQLCKIDPKMAEETVVEFSRYLRSNLDSLTLKEPIPFEQELHHVENYLAIEKKRFPDILKIKYDIEKKDFFLPALTLQAIVENAVRYGITKKEKGGTVKIKTHEAEGNAVITVIDDGAGFDTNQRQQDGRSHVGIENVRKRLSAMCGGSMEIQSKPGEGTCVVIKIPLGGRT